MLLEGLEAVKKRGKAKTLGERALRHPDPGAISIYLILKFMWESVSDEKSQP